MWRAHAQSGLCFPFVSHDWHTKKTHCLFSSIFAMQVFRTGLRCIVTRNGERTHLQHAGYVKTRFFVLPHTSPKVERADPRHRCGIVRHNRRGELRFAFAAQTARRGHFMRGYEAESGCIFHQHLLTDMNQGWCQTQISILLTAHLCLINDWARCCHDYPAERPSGVHSVSSPLPITLTLSSDTQESLPLDSAWAVKCRDHIS